MHRHSRRRFLQSSLAMAGFSLLSAGELHSQQPAKGPRIGFLAVGSREHGYVEGQNIVIEYRFSGDRNDRLPALAAELVALKVELILASGTPASFAAKQATSSIPIVVGSISDAVETGLVVSLARPGGNVTGMSGMSSQFGGRRLALLRAIVPGLARVAVLAARCTDGRTSARGRRVRSG
jgi:putative ABC transport system substrate-binding protein